MLYQGALTGYTVLDLSRLLPGPYCSMILADHGARVIAIEDSRYELDEFYIYPVYRNKEHMTLNLKSDEGQRIFHRLLDKADVVLEGFRPGVVERLRVDYKSVSKNHPEIVYCSISGYGQTGPLSNRVGHDVNYLAQAGVLDLIGSDTGPPVIPGVQIADIAGGAFNAALGILMALLAREKSGHGQYIDISMTDGILGLLTAPLFVQEHSGQKSKRGNFRLSHRYACYNIYETKDGRFVAIGAVEYKFWKRLCEVLELSQYIEFQYDDELRAEIISSLQSEFMKKTLVEWDSILSDQDVCWAPVRTADEALRAPLFMQRDMIAKIAGGTTERLPIPGNPIKLSDTPGTVHRNPPKFGQDTEVILAELGYDGEQIEQFKKNNVV